MATFHKGSTRPALSRSANCSARARAFTSTAFCRFRLSRIRVATAAGISKANSSTTNRGRRRLLTGAAPGARAGSSVWRTVMAWLAAPARRGAATPAGASPVPGPVGNASANCCPAARCGQSVLPGEGGAGVTSIKQRLFLAFAPACQTGRCGVEWQCHGAGPRRSCQQHPIQRSSHEPRRFFPGAAAPDGGHGQSPGRRLAAACGGARELGPQVPGGPTRQWGGHGQRPLPRHPARHRKRRPRDPLRDRSHPHAVAPHREITAGRPGGRALRLARNPQAPPDAHRLSTPMYSVRERLVALRDDALSPKGFDELARSGALVATQAGASYADKLRQHGVAVDETDTMAALRNIVRRRVRYYYGNELTCVFYIKAGQMRAELGLVPGVMGETPSHFWAGKHLEPAVVKRLDAALLKLKRNGALERIYNRYAEMR